MLTKNFIRYLYGCSDWNNARGNRQNASVIKPITIKANGGVQVLGIDLG